MVRVWHGCIEKGVWRWVYGEGSLERGLWRGGYGGGDAQKERVGKLSPGHF